jgi:hypothetical protein
MDWVQQVVVTRCSKWGDQVKQVMLPGAPSNVTIQVQQVKYINAFVLPGAALVSLPICLSFFIRNSN